MQFFSFRIALRNLIESILLSSTLRRISERFISEKQVIISSDSLLYALFFAFWIIVQAVNVEILIFL